MSSSSGNNSNYRSNSSSYRRDRNDSNKETRGDQRGYGNGHKYDDYKMNERNRSRDFRSDYRDNRRLQRDNNERGGGKHTSSWQPRDRYSGESSSYNGRHRSPDRSRDRRSDNYRSDYHRRSPSPHHYKKSSRHDHSKRSGRNSRSPRSPSPRTRSSRSRSKSRERPTAAANALEQARLSALEMERKLNATAERSDTESPKISTIRGRNEALSSLPLSDNAPKQPNVIAVAPPALVTSSSSNASIVEPAIIQLPSYYNPNIINPNKYAAQVQKRKLLWGAKKADDNASKWGSAQFSQDSDGKVASKFMRLMGIKSGAPAPATTATCSQSDAATGSDEKSVRAAPDIKLREDMFSNMEQQYEVARQATHTMRGVGLGFSSQTRPF